jgi:hypothetical protein
MGYMKKIIEHFGKNQKAQLWFFRAALIFLLFFIIIDVILWHL